MNKEDRVIIRACIGLLVSVFPPILAASWSAFVIVTPDNDTEIFIDITVNQSQKDSCQLLIKAVNYPLKRAWLVEAKQPLTQQQQELRYIIWDRKPVPEYISSFTPIETPATIDGAEYYRINVDPTNSSVWYVYIDFRSPVFDGGYYYSIDMASYCKN